MFKLTSLLASGDLNQKRLGVKKWKELQARKDLKVATFAGGCFWCMEGPFESLPGVSEAITGFAGGEVENPSYAEFVKGNTGHRESVQVFYDPKKISFKELLDGYWTQIDPTDPDGQFADRGFSYTTAIFCNDEGERRIAEEEIRKLNESGKFDKEIVTSVLPYTSFYPAEDYHQDFYKHSAERYNSYKEGSGRAEYIRANKDKDFA
jgi:methionine-S-sulfoxide reductase